MSKTKQQYCNILYTAIINIRASHKQVATKAEAIVALCLPEHCEPSAGSRFVSSRPGYVTFNYLINDLFSLKETT